MRLPLSDYKTIIFDCDGVVLNSNKVKTKAFYEAALPFGEEAANELVTYHVLNGGISRYKKFDYFLDEIVKKKSDTALQELLDVYAQQVRVGLLSCEVTPGLSTLRQLTSGVRWLIVSGGDQVELREIFSERRLDLLFDGGIYGSPDIKEIILSREIMQKNIKQPAIFIGDSKYDYAAARSASIDFLFVSDWTEVVHWQRWVKENNISHRGSIKDIFVE